MQPFYSEYMERRRPKTPGCICENEFKRQLGIVSPSLCGIVAAITGNMAHQRAAKAQTANIARFHHAGKGAGEND